jgi:hypothetical protein
MKVREHKSPKYSSRTELNANSADLTIACAEDYESGGEILTRRLAEARGEERYLKLPLSMKPIEAARLLWKRCKALNVRTLNIAGNGIYTLKKFGWTDDSVNEWMYQVIKQVSEHHQFELIISGGQTGADFAGGVAAEALGIDAVMTFPKGFKQRTLTAYELIQTEDDVMRTLALQLQVLRENHPELPVAVQAPGKSRRPSEPEDGFCLS